MKHEARSNDRLTSQAWRVVLAVQEDDLDAAWAVMDELGDDPFALRSLTVIVAAIAGTRRTEAEALKRVGRALDLELLDRLDADLTDDPDDVDNTDGTAE